MANLSTLYANTILFSNLTEESALKKFHSLSISKQEAAIFKGKQLLLESIQRSFGADSTNASVYTLYESSAVPILGFFDEAKKSGYTLADHESDVRRFTDSEKREMEHAVEEAFQSILLRKMSENSIQSQIQNMRETIKMLEEQLDMLEHIAGKNANLS